MESQPRWRKNVKKEEDLEEAEKDTIKTQKEDNMWDTEEK